jgi:hypothetical protein
MNEIISKQSEAEQKAYLERCKQSGKLVMFDLRRDSNDILSGSVVNKYGFADIEVASKSMHTWLQQFSTIRVHGKHANGGIFMMVDQMAEDVPVTSITLEPRDSIVYFGDELKGNMYYDDIVDIIGKSPESKYVLTEQQVSMIMGQTFETSTLTIKDCEAFIKNENVLCVDGGWMNITMLSMCTEIK